MERGTRQKKNSEASALKLPDPASVPHNVGPSGARAAYNYIENHGTLILNSGESTLQGVSVNTRQEGVVAKDPKKEQSNNESVNIRASKSTVRNVSADGMSTNINASDDALVDNIQARSAKVSLLSRWLPTQKAKIIAALIGAGGPIALVLVKYFLGK